jgi:hypothetical protein
MRQKVHLRAVAKIGVGNYDNSNVSIGRKSELTRLDISNIGLLHDNLVNLISSPVCRKIVVFVWQHLQKIKERNSHAYHDSS